MIVETERLIITELTADMAQAVHENSLDEDTRRFVPDEVFETPEAAREAVAYLISRYGNPDGPQVYAALTKDGNANIGYVQLVPIGDGKWEIGYHIGKRYTGRVEHYMTEFAVIMSSQGIDHDSDLYKSLYKAIFLQRPLRSQKHLVGKCPLEPNSPRAQIG